MSSSTDCTFIKSVKAHLISYKVAIMMPYLEMGSAMGISHERAVHYMYLRALDKREYMMILFFISHRNHML